MSKQRLLITALGTTLLLSLAGNAWLFATIRMYKYNVRQGWFTHSHDGLPQYPISGISPDELKSMIDTIAHEAGDSEDRNVLLIEVIDKNRVDIRTGMLDAPLAGRGSIFRFKRTEKAWELDRSKVGTWMS